MIKYKTSGAKNLCGILLFTLLVMVCISCSINRSSPVGLYLIENSEYQGAYLHLYDDGTAELSGLKGNWQKSGDQVILTITSSPFIYGNGAICFQIEDNNLRDPEGNLYIKK